MDSQIRVQNYASIAAIPTPVRIQRGIEGLRRTTLSNAESVLKDTKMPSKDRLRLRVLNCLRRYTNTREYT